MSRLESFINKYGEDKGPKLLRILAANAANARWKSYYREKSLR